MRTIALLLAAALCCGRADAAVPHQITYQGFLAATTGAPVTAAVPMAINIYAASEGGSPLYTETQTVSVTNGIFEVTIGAVTPLSLPFDVPYWLGVAVGTDAEMVPRQPITAVGYALNAASSDALAVTATVPGSQLSGTVAAARLPALTGDVTTAAGSTATILAAVNATPGTFGDGTHVGQFAVNAKGLITAASNVPITASALKSLVAMTAEPPGINCTYGGTKVTSGVDLNSSGTLDAGEVSATGYACNGTPYAVVPSVPAGCGTQPLSLGTPVYVSPAGPGGVVYRGDAVSFSVSVTDPNVCNSVTVANNYIWTLVSKPLGSTASLSSTTAASPTLVADVAGGTYQLSVQVIDTLGNKSPTALVGVNVSACGAQAPVIVSTQAPASVYTSTDNPVGLVASSPDSQNNNNPAAGNYCPPRFAKSLAYQWSIAGAPANGNAHLSTLVSAGPTFSAGTVVGSYLLHAVVTDNTGLSSPTASLSIPVVLCGTAPLSWPPVNAVSPSVSDPDPSSPAGQANVGTQVALLPSVIDPNACAGAPVTQSYQWVLSAVPNGSTAKLVVDTAGVARFIPDLVGAYQLQVTATDSLGNASPLFNTSVTTSTCGANPVSVTAKANGATLPVGTTSGNPVIVGFGTSNGIGLVNGVAQSADNVSPACPSRFATGFSYAWSIVNAPPGSTAQLTNVDGTATGFLAGATAGLYQVQVVATAATNGRSSPPSYVFFQVN